MGIFRKKGEQQRLNERLLKACRGGNLPEVEKCLDAGADLDAGNPKSYSPLFVAIKYGQDAVSKLLLEKKADINTPFLAAMPVSYEHNIVPEGTLLMMACILQKKDVIDLLLSHGAELDAKDSEGLTALHHAAKKGDFSIVQRLVKHGADVNVFDNEGNKPETLARSWHHNGIADFLRDCAINKKPPADVRTGWVLTAPEEVACVTEKKEISYRLTDIFNFESGTCTRIVTNTVTAVESQTVRFFEEFPNKKMLEHAYKKLVELGGEADATSIRRSLFASGAKPQP